MSGYPVWLIIAALAVGTFLIRFSFIGLTGNRPLPPALLRYLRYTPFAVLPALVAPMLAWPAATDGTADPARLLAALATVLVGWRSKSLLFAILAGLVVFYGAAALGL
ncbi:AzlD domain-containing protein [Vannielia litorea]|uniref:Branched-chain amino acid transport protein n=1 Tax=Vannielia litorea TaxID=1217970 RepID=A0A1N6HPH7_9RHOB|nr:AzlD domain-containing protein [Vannielia litorea]SIO21682.1 Branched-chain amino acid transport protein [Vannielia litorea]